MNDKPNLTFGVSDFVAVFNQTLEFAYSSVSIVGELSDMQIRKGRWLYFNLKDELASVKFFGTVSQLPGPLENGMLLEVRATPKLHPLYGFTLNVLSLRPVGKGAIKRAADLLEAKLVAEGLFDPSRKRALPYPPSNIGLIASSESAAYADFIKVVNHRFGGVSIDLVDVTVQGELAAAQIIEAIDYFNQGSKTPDVLVITRGGGSAEDLAAFNTESVVRAVAGSRVPTMVAIGHEVDLSLSEKVADKRASTPSNAAELLVPDRESLLAELKNISKHFKNRINSTFDFETEQNNHFRKQIETAFVSLINNEQKYLSSATKLINAISPEAILRRGYAIVSRGKNIINSANLIKNNEIIAIKFHDGEITAQSREVRLN